MVEAVEKSRKTPRLGAEHQDGRTTFRVYATTAKQVAVRLFQDDGRTPARSVDLASTGDAFFEVTVDFAPPGTLYKVVLDGAEWPDPYARILPLGVHGPAQVAGDTFAWKHGPGVRRPLSEHVIYELHVGTFTNEGTYAAAVQKLPALVALGATAIELLPICAFPGTRGWGYDGVMHFAPFAPYGSPDDLRRLVDAAHGLGLSVLLDAVYNHFGPDGNYLGVYSPGYFDKVHPTRWGDAPDFANPVARAYVTESARMWLESYRFDGLRLDATHAMTDDSPVHVLRELADLAHAMQPPRLVIAEDDMNDPRLVRDQHMDAIWTDDFHRQLHATLTGAQEGNFAAYTPGAQGLAETIRKGWLFTGQHFGPWNVARGASAAGLPASTFVYGIQNHDHVGNRPSGDRMCHHASLEAYKSAAALLLFLPMVPLLFQGQEWAASTPFLYFTDHHQGLGTLVANGRKDEFRGFPGWSGEVPHPQSLETFTRSKLQWEERDLLPHACILALYTQLIRLRQHDPVLRGAGRDDLSARADGDLLIVRRWSGKASRVLVVSFGDAPEELTNVDELFDPRTARLGVLAEEDEPGLLLSTEPLERPFVLPAHAAAIFAPT
jgi:maltooligosyltrehalose trehalohydrolase